MTSPPFDYDAAAEIYPSRARGSRRHPVGYKRFDSAAEALQFAIEQLPADALVGAYLEIGEERYDAREMRTLYDAPAYPLPRTAPFDPTNTRRTNPVSAPAAPTAPIATTLAAPSTILTTPLCRAA